MIPDPTHAWLFWTRTSGFLSWAIRRITNGQWSHMGLGFTGPDGEVYFEALFQEGWNGPKRFSRLTTWHDEAPGNNIYERRELFWLTDDEVAVLYSFARTCVGQQSYSAWQLIRMWYFERIGRRHGLSVRPSEKVVCSEAVARLLFHHARVDLRDLQRTTFDSVSPQSAYDRYWPLAAKSRE